MMMKVEQPPAHRLLQLEALILSLAITSPKLPPRDKVDDQASEEVVDIDDLFLPKRQWWGGSSWPWWQAPSSSSWRRRGCRSCEASPPLEPFACSEWLCQAATRFQMGKGWLGSACSCQLNWKITLKLLPRSSQSTQAIIANIIYLRTCPLQLWRQSGAPSDQLANFSVSLTWIS